MASSKQPGMPIRASLTINKPGTDPVTPYNLNTDIEKLYVYVYVKPERMIAQFCTDAEAGYLPIEVTNAATGQISIEVPGANTKDLRAVQLHIVADARMSSGGVPFKFGTLNGKEYEFVYITSHPRPGIS